jgi:hypothetical protein
MIDRRHVSIRGSFSYARARVLWENGILRIYGPGGIMLEVQSQIPVKKVGYLRAWDIATAKGTIVARGKCMTCGGRKWWKITSMPKDKLWNLSWT